MSHDDEQERAQRSVERMFPEVARFLGRERPGMPVYGPTDPFGDEEHEPDVIVRVDFLMSREQIMEAVWDANWFGPTKTLDVHVAALRRKLAGAVVIEAVRGVGFRLEIAEDDGAS